MSSDNEMDKQEVKIMQGGQRLRDVFKNHWPLGMKVLELVSTSINYFYRQFIYCFVYNENSI